MENWVPPLCYGVNLSCGPTYFEEHKDGRRGAIYVVYIEKMRQKKKEDVERQTEEWMFF